MQKSQSQNTTNFLSCVHCHHFAFLRAVVCHCFLPLPGSPLQMAAGAAARRAWAWARLTTQFRSPPVRKVEAAKSDKDDIWNVVALVGLPLGLWALAQQREPSDDHEAARWAQLTGSVAVDTALFLTPAVAGGHTLLSGDAFCLPTTLEERRNLLAYCLWVKSIAGAQASSSGPLWDPAKVATKYGAYVELCLANPFLQDQMLGDPASWATVVQLGRQVLVHTAADYLFGDRALETGVRREARRFLNAYDRESAECRPRMKKLAAIKDPAALEAERGKLRTLVAGSEPDGCYLYCRYTTNTVNARRRLARTSPTVSTAAPPPSGVSTQLR